MVIGGVFFVGRTIMWRETKLLLIDDNLERRRDLSVILNFLGEDHLACGSGDWRKVVEQIDSSRSILGVLLGEVQLKGGALDLSLIHI